MHDSGENGLESLMCDCGGTHSCRKFGYHRLQQHEEIGGMREFRRMKQRKGRETEKVRGSKGAALVAGGLRRGRGEERESGERKGGEGS